MTKLSIVRQRSNPPTRTTGSLDDFSFAELAQIMALGGKTGCVRISDGDFHGEAWFVDGRLRHARINNQAGEEAFMSLVRWTSGVFQIAHGAVPFRPAMDHDAMHLLMKSMKAMDESSAPGEVEAV